MSIVKINAITVPEGSGDELAQRFAARAGAVDGQPGFEGFELLQPTDGRNTWLVVTRWADEASFEAWRDGSAFGRAHGQGEPGGQPGGGSGEPGKGPVGMSAELWSYAVATGSSGQAE